MSLPSSLAPLASIELVLSQLLFKTSARLQHLKYLHRLSAQRSTGYPGLLTRPTLTGYHWTRGAMCSFHTCNPAFDEATGRGLAAHVVGRVGCVVVVNRGDCKHVLNVCPRIFGTGKTTVYNIPSVHSVQTKKKTFMFYFHHLI